MIWSLLIAGGAVLAVFVVVESRTNAPLIEVDLFRNASFTVANLVVLLAQFTKIAIIVIGALYLQSALDMTPLVAGAALLAAVHRSRSPPRSSDASPIVSARAGRRWWRCS